MAITLINHGTTAYNNFKLTWTPVVGNLVIVVAFNTPAVGFQAPTDNFGNTWSKSSVASDGACSIQAFYSTITTTGVGMTMNFLTASSGVVIYEFSGVSAALDVQNTNNSGYGTALTAVATTTSAVDLVLASFIGDTYVSWGATGGGFSTPADHSTGTGATAWRTTSSVGTYTCSISNTFNYGWVSLIVALKVSPGDFEVRSSPISQTVNAGSSTSYILTASPLGGYIGTITPSVLSGLPTGATATWSPTTITGGSGTSTCTISSTGATVPGTYGLTFSGTDGSLTHSDVYAPITYIVTNKDFSVAVSPSSRSVIAGGATTYTFTVAALNGYTSTVTPSILSGLPSGATAVWSPTTIPGGSGTSTCTVSSTTPAVGTYTLTMKGTDGTLTHNVTSTYIVATAGFTVTTSTANLTITAGVPITMTMAMTVFGGYVATITPSVLSGLPTGLTASWSPTTISGGSGTSTLTLTPTQAVVPGTYVLTLQATGAGAATQTIAVNAIISNSLMRGEVFVFQPVTPPTGMGLVYCQASEDQIAAAQADPTIIVCPTNLQLLAPPQAIQSYYTQGALPGMTMDAFLSMLGKIDPNFLIDPTITGGVPYASYWTQSLSTAVGATRASLGVAANGIGLTRLLLPVSVSFSNIFAVAFGTLETTYLHSVGVYSMDGLLIVASTPQIYPASGIFPVTPTVLSAGQYYLAWACTGTTTVSQGSNQTWMPTWAKAGTITQSVGGQLPNAIAVPQMGNVAPVVMGVVFTWGFV